MCATIINVRVLRRGMSLPTSPGCSASDERREKPLNRVMVFWMNGVVIWVDAESSEAIVWCEDHDELAYCDLSLEESIRPCTPGLWVTFRLKDDTGVRVAYDIAPAAHPDSPDLALLLRSPLQTGFLL